MSNATHDPASSSSCCGGSAAKTADSEGVRDAVRAGYGQIARETASSSCCEPAPEAKASSCCAPAPSSSGCCGTSAATPDDIATALGYSPADLAMLPQGANMGLSCGNPTALAALQPGQVVVDLGSGGGFDCFLAGPRVGAEGRVIGIDMTPDMITLARRNVAQYRESSGLDNVEFRLGEIEHLPVADASVDVLVSNCVLNLSPDKPQVWREIARVLRPGGRVAISDLALLAPLPAEVRADVEALVGCVAGAALVEDVRSMAVAAGLDGVEIQPRAEHSAVLQTQDPLYDRILSRLPAGKTPADYVVSVDIVARRRRA